MMLKIMRMDINLLTRIIIPQNTLYHEVRCSTTDCSQNNVKEIASQGVERDLVNFPRPVRAECPGKVRFGFIPQEWFDILYYKTGVTGPYTLALGTTTYLLSKEIFVMEHNFFNGISMGILTTIAVKKLSPLTTAYADKEIEKIENFYKEARIRYIKHYEDAIIREKKEQWRAEGQKLLFDAKRMTILYQLEAEYRERLMDAYNKVKLRLDWEAEQERVIRNLKIKHMVQWIHKEVNQLVVSNAFDKKFIKQCIAELNSMAPKTQQKQIHVRSGGSVLSSRTSARQPQMLL